MKLTVHMVEQLDPTGNPYEPRAFLPFMFNGAIAAFRTEADARKALWLCKNAQWFAETRYRIVTAEVQDG